MGDRVLAGIHQIKVACSMTVELDRVSMTWNTMAAYMDAVNQVVPTHASVSFSDEGEAVTLQFVWAETREPAYRVESDRVGVLEAVKAPESPEAAREPGKPEKPVRAGSGAVTRRS